MNYSDLLILLFIFIIARFSGAIGTIFTGLINKFLINQFLTESIFRIILNLFFVVLFSFLSSMIGLLTILGFAADENAGDIFPYYLSISFIVCVLNTVTYYFTIKIKQN